jgi:hypothetical protein
MMMKWPLLIDFEYFDRAVFSTPVERLQDKARGFPLGTTRRSPHAPAAFARSVVRLPEALKEHDGIRRIGWLPRARRTGPVGGSRKRAD